MFSVFFLLFFFDMGYIGFRYYIICWHIWCNRKNERQIGDASLSRLSELRFVVYPLICCVLIFLVTSHYPVVRSKFYLKGVFNFLDFNVESIVGCLSVCDAWSFFMMYMGSNVSISFILLNISECTAVDLFCFSAAVLLFLWYGHGQ